MSCLSFSRQLHHSCFFSLLIIPHPTPSHLKHTTAARALRRSTARERKERKGGGGCVPFPPVKTYTSRTSHPRSYTEDAKHLSNYLLYTEPPSDINMPHLPRLLRVWLRTQNRRQRQRQHQRQKYTDASSSGLVWLLFYY